MSRRHLRHSDLEITHTKGSGPGGQNRNKRMTAVRVRHIPTGITVLATERRSQAQNLEAALSRLEEKVAAHYYRPAARHATAPTRASEKKRVKAKHERSKVKSMRQKPRDGDW